MEGFKPQASGTAESEQSREQHALWRELGGRDKAEQSRIVKLVPWYGGPICGMLSLLFYNLGPLFAFLYLLGFLNDLVCGGEGFFCGHEAVLGGGPP